MGGHKGIWPQEKAAIWVARLRRNDRFNFGGVVNRRGHHLHSKGRSSGFEGAQVKFDVWRIKREPVHVSGERPAANVSASMTNSLDSHPLYRRIVIAITSGTGGCARDAACDDCHITQKET
jgi:hypothetical protein